MPTFRIQYYTHWGEELHIDFGSHVHSMNYDSEGYWYVALSPSDIKGPVDYTYFVTENGRVTRREWHGHHLDAVNPDAVIIDWWKDKPDAPLYSEAFTQIVGADKVDDATTEALSAEIAKKIQDEMTYPGQVKITVIREVRSVAVAK